MCKERSREHNGSGSAGMRHPQSQWFADSPTKNLRAIVMDVVEEVR